MAQPPSPSNRHAEALRLPDQLALTWLRRAAAQGYEPARKTLASYDTALRERRGKPLSSSDWFALAAAAVIGLSLLDAANEKSSGSSGSEDDKARERRYRACLDESDRCTSACTPTPWNPGLQYACKAGCMSRDLCQRY